MVERNWESEERKHKAEHDQRPHPLGEIEIIREHSQVETNHEQGTSEGGHLEGKDKDSCTVQSLM